MRPPKLFNTVVTWLLRSPLHAMMSDSLMLITYSSGQKR
jgi:hypothetical protein